MDEGETRTQRRGLRRLGAALACALLAATGAAAAPVRLILDTDFRTDVDDPGTLAMLHGLWNEGRTEVAGVVSSTAGASVVGAIDAVNTYFRRPDVAIGLIAPARASGGGDPYAPTLANTSLYPSDQTSAAAPGSTALYRQLLHAADDASIAIVVVGGQNAVYDLMVSTNNHNGDGISATGMELAQAKVSELVVMGGNFASSTATENNILRGVAAAQQVAAVWPTPVVYSGWEVGSGVKTGAALTNPAVNPVTKAYEIFVGLGNNRDSWDQTAALYAVVGATYGTQTLWSLSAPHNITFDSSGRTIKTPSETSTRRYMVKTLANAGIASVISGLMTAAPYEDPVSGPALRVRGNGLAIANGDATPSLADHTDFGTTDVAGATLSRTYTVENYGTEALAVGTVTLVGAGAVDFAVTAQPASVVAPGTSTTFTVAFDPIAAGVRSATLSFGNGDPAGSPFGFALQGAGYQAPSDDTGGTGGAYRPDAHTLALYHFDEDAGASDPGTAIANHGSAGTVLALTNTGGPDGRDNSPTAGGGFGAEAFPTLGKAFSVLGSGDGTYHTATSAGGGGALTAGAVSQNLLQGADGAFTYEALATFATSSGEQQILAHDGSTTRGFLFRVVGGKLSLYTGSAEFTATLPATGRHAFASNTWFHVAVAYNGAAGQAGNLAFYWTRMDTGATVANRIGAATLTADLSGAVNNTFGVGTTTRNPFRYECGVVDEVRISAVARAASEFLLGLPRGPSRS